MTDTEQDIKIRAACSACDAAVTGTFADGSFTWTDSAGFEDASHPYPHEHDGTM